MQFLPNTLFTFVVFQNSQPSNVALISAISALLGALIGGISSFLVCVYTIKKEREKEIFQRKISLLNEVSKNFLEQLIDYKYDLEIQNNTDVAKNLLLYLREKRNYFLYCPIDMKRKLESLYIKIEENKGVFESGEQKEIINDIAEIEKEFYSSFIEIKL